MGLSQRQVEDICQIRRNGQCRYLAWENSQNGHVFLCAKKSFERKGIDIEIDEFIEDCKKKNINPHTSGKPIGDNCKGYLPFTALEQGYDKD